MDSQMTAVADGGRYILARHNTVWPGEKGRTVCMTPGEWSEYGSNPAWTLLSRWTTANDAAAAQKKYEKDEDDNSTCIRAVLFNNGIPSSEWKHIVIKAPYNADEYLEDGYEFWAFLPDYGSAVAAADRLRAWERDWNNDYWRIWETVDFTKASEEAYVLLTKNDPDPEGYTLMESFSDNGEATEALQAARSTWYLKRARTEVPSDYTILPDRFSYIDLSDYDFRRALAAARLYDEDHSLITILGSGGSGKSEIYKIVWQDDPEHTLPLALTGLAAVKLENEGVKGCCTVNRGLRIGTGWLNTKKTSVRLIEQLNRWDTILIDEVSMMDINMMEYLLRHVMLADRQRPEQRGKIKLVLFGDPLQLLPVVEEANRKRHEELYHGKRLFFNSEAWKAFPRKVFILSKSYRQKDDPEFAALLNRVRLGIATDEDAALLNTRVMSREELKEETGAESLCLASSNATVNAINEEHVIANAGQPCVVHHRCQIMVGKKNACPQIPETIVLFKGDPVMFCQNDTGAPGERRFANGLIGKVTGFSESGLPMVELPNGLTVEAPRVVTKDGNSEDDRKVVTDIIIQLACKAAYAVTYHKAQGLSLDSVYLDNSDYMQEHMYYLGLSRVRTLRGLGLSSPVTKEILNSNITAEAKDWFCSVTDRETVGEIDLSDMTAGDLEMTETYGGKVPEKGILQRRRNR